MRVLYSCLEFQGQGTGLYAIVSPTPLREDPQQMTEPLAAQTEEEEAVQQAASRDLFYSTFLAALLDHHEWTSRIHRAILRGACTDPDIMGDTAYRQTRFAQFLDMVQPHLMQQVELVRSAHFQAFHLAQQMVEESIRGRDIDADRYEDLLVAFDRFRHVAARLIEHADDLSPGVDEPTHLFTRDYMDTRLSEQCDLARRASQPFCLGLAELDQFAELEKSHGFQVLNVVLREVARRVLATVRRYDNVFRFENNQISFIFPATRLRDAVMVSERLRANVANEPIETPIGEESVTLSIGVLEYGRGELPEDLLKVAAANLAHARNEGRNRVIS